MTLTIHRFGISHSNSANLSCIQKAVSFRVFGSGRRPAQGLLGNSRELVEGHDDYRHKGLHLWNDALDDLVKGF
eukprot:CAMPEP_0168348988 /NCGR_PEP_ID=MMETSP0213-20121227/20111_1 /TAXON_ID=151035 /ORGANISM="Euplotes harpa, Strain FSP1.4" /LENGTH=73 /DNA_ID=CAMNT_0008358769 /DNA_START=838 /DNA_END=1059 /DNA_ORIENTATION=-